MWTTKIPSPSEQGAFLAVQCSAKYVKESKTIELSQAVKEFQVEAAIDAKLDSVITVESLTGRVTSIHDRLVLNENGKKIRTLWYDEEL